MSKQAPADMANPFGDLSKLLEQFKVPGLDMGAIVESRRKDMDALIATNQAMLDSMQGLAKKQAEILAQALQGVQANVQALVKGGAGAAVPTEQAELARKAYEKAVAQMTELSEIARKAQADAMAGITARAQQSVQEMKALVQPK